MYQEQDLILEKAKNDCYSRVTEEKPNFCKLIFDGLMCWNETAAGVVAQQSCSNNYLIPTRIGLASKVCDESGEWFKLPITNESWTNYTECGPIVVGKTVYDQNHTTDHNYTIYYTWLPIIQRVSQFGNILSLLSLVMALYIFVHIKSLHCARNQLHMHLFASFVMRAIMSLIKETLFVKGVALPHEVMYREDGEPDFHKVHYSWLCKAIISLRNYFIISNYSFLLMEGAYLHNLLFLNLFSENGVSVYYLFGWGFPLPFVVPWIILKANMENIQCWTKIENKYVSALIDDIPIGISVIINFIFFSIIMRVLFRKLSSMYVEHTWLKYGKLIRAILILVPLFGIPYTISFAFKYYAIRKSPTLETLWIFFDQTFTALQGLFASLAYCLNSEVQVEIMRKYRSFRDRQTQLNRRSRTISHTTQIQLIEELQDLETRM